MNAPRIVLALIAGMATALIAYGVALSHGRPFPLRRVGDSLLAYHLIPLELLIGLLVGAGVYWLVGQKQAATPRIDIQQRMVLRFAHRCGGAFTWQQLSEQSPLEPTQARAALNALLEQGQLRAEGEGYRLP